MSRGDCERSRSGDGGYVGCGRSLKSEGHVKGGSCEVCAGAFCRGRFGW